jgi:hypothetical protein
MRNLKKNLKPTAIPAQGLDFSDSEKSTLDKL